jgi:hypothetical protein
MYPAIPLRLTFFLSSSASGQPRFPRAPIFQRDLLPLLAQPRFPHASRPHLLVFPTVGTIITPKGSH